MDYFQRCRKERDWLYFHRHATHFYRHPCVQQLQHRRWPSHGTRLHGCQHHARWRRLDSSNDPRSQTRRCYRPKPYNSSYYSSTGLRLYQHRLISTPSTQPHLRHYWNRTGDRWSSQLAQTRQDIQWEPSHWGRRGDSWRKTGQAHNYWVYRDLQGVKTEDGRRNPQLRQGKTTASHRN